jgi:hypothetical protein
MTQDTTRASTIGEKSQETNEPGYMAINLTLVIPCYTIPENTKVEDITDEQFALIADEISSNKNLQFAQALAQKTGLSLLEQIKGSKVFYNGLVNFTDEEEIKLDGNSSR